MKTINFGTDGIRTQIGQEPLVPDTLIQLGKCISLWKKESFPNTPIIIGHDTRYSAAFCKASLKVGLLQNNSTIHDYGTIPTPLLYHLTKEYKAVGIMITASHNLAPDNGIKLFTPHGKLTKEEQEALVSFLNKKLPETNFEFLGSEIIKYNALEWYQDKLEQFFSFEFLKYKKIVLDCANGAYSNIASEILKSFGASVTTIHNTPDGYNINKDCGSLHPEDLQATVVKQNADIGFAFDGDGDRITVVTQDGIIKDGNDILAFLLNHPRYKKNTQIVGTVMSNQGFEEYLKKQGRTLLRTPVGDAYVTRKLKEEGLTLGGEPSGHIILRDFSDTSDVLFTALRICETALLLKDWTIKSFEKFPQKLWALKVTVKKDLTKGKLAILLQETEDKLQGGRLLVRYSGTESVLRVMIEAQEDDQATILGEKLCKQLKKELV
jgi:phosphoglucosamine mutase